MQKQKAPAYFICDFTLCMTVYWMTTGTLIAKLTESFNLSVALSNFVVSMPSMLLLTQLFGGFFYSKTRKKHIFLLSTNVIWRMLAPCVFFSVLLPIEIGAAVMIICYMSMIGTYHFSAPAYNTWLVNTTSGKVKSNYLSVRDTAFISLFTVTTFAYGMLADRATASNTLAKGFTSIGIAQLLFAAASLFFLFKRLPPPTGESASVNLSLKEIFLKPFQTKGYYKIIIQNTVWNFACMFIGNFAAIYQVRVLNIEFSKIVLWGTVANIVRVVCTAVFGKIAEKIGWKPVTLIMLSFVLIAGVSWALSNKTNAWLVLPVSTICLGISNAALGIGLFKYQVAYSKPETRSLSFSLCSALSGVAALLGTSLCTTLVAIIEKSPSPAFWIIFLIGIVLVVVVMLAVHLTPYKEPE